MSELFYGDNLSVLRDSVRDESVDLIYLDPPFNSNASYNILFKAPTGENSRAQIEAFEDTWHWNDSAESAFDDVMRSDHSDAATVLRAVRSALGENDMMAYLAMMTVRLVELHRVLKPTGTIYLHCDPTASHYLKVILDAIFGAPEFGNEIIWQRTNAKGLASTRFARNHDTILRYTKSGKWTWNAQYTPHNESYVDSFYKYKDADGRVFRLADLTNPNKNRPNLTYEFLGVTRVWRWTRERMQKAYEDGLIIQSKPGGVPSLKRYLDEQEGNPVGDVWTDIAPVQAQADERLGYPTQKPVALLERIINASSNAGDIVLDPFCGCGTTVHASQKLDRQWVGIDVTHLAIALVERRLKESFEGIRFAIHGVPTDVEGARNLAERDKHEFQKWITAKIGGQPYKGGKKGMDRGVDGFLHFRDALKKPQFAIISVKGGGHKSGDVRDLKGTMEREKAALGIFLTLNEPTREMEREAASAGFYETGGKRFPRLQILTAAQILEDRKPQVPFGFTDGFRKAGREAITGQQLLF
jgi:site-specific DNA-methyltransferase (adenine-specific)